MVKQSKQQREHKREDKLTRTRSRVKQAISKLRGSILAPLLANVSILECDEDEAEVEIGCVSPAANAIWINPHRRQELGEQEWMFIIAHLLLHLGLGHKLPLPHRHAGLWTLACEHAVDNLADSLRIGKPPHDYLVDTLYAGMSEEAIYEAIGEDRQALAVLKTYAGRNRPDIVKRDPHFPNLTDYSTLFVRGEARRDYETMLAEGIRSGVETAVEQASDLLGVFETERKKTWRPVENAKRWVLNELPLLGALAAQLRIITDPQLCDRMDIPIAAVNAQLGEIYFHTQRGLSQEEVLFVYVHELLDFLHKSTHRAPSCR